MISLINVYVGKNVLPGAIQFLYELLQERDKSSNISHKSLPTLPQHTGFVRKHPYRAWHIIALTEYGKTYWLGSISITHQNEIGIAVLKEFSGKGYATDALKKLMAMYRCNSRQESARYGGWLANIAPKNERSKHLFEKLGFRKIQETFAIEEEIYAQEAASS